jgi:hypothetical protein
MKNDVKRGGTNSGIQYNPVRLSERRAQPPCDARPQIGFRSCRRDVHAAVDEAVDQGADDLGPVQKFAALAAKVGGEVVEVKDLTIEEHD